MKLALTLVAAAACVFFGIVSLSVAIDHKTFTTTAEIIDGVIACLFGVCLFAWAARRK